MENHQVKMEITSRTKCRCSLAKLFLGYLSLIVIVCLMGGCSEPETRSATFGVPDQTAWLNSLDEGWRVRLAAADKAATIYHLICDTPIQELLSDRVSTQIGQMVTEARDIYRRSESYAIRNIPPLLNGVTVNCSTLGSKVEVYYNYDNPRDPKMVVCSLRGRIILKNGISTLGPYIDWEDPFASIVKGDKVDLQNIPSFIARIKR